MLASPVESVEEALKRFAQEVAGGALTQVNPQRRGCIWGTRRWPSGAEAPSLSGADGTAEAVPLQEQDPVPIGPTVTAGVLKEAQIEDKYDGIRAQLHCGDPEQPGRVALFSRSREDMTAAFPELAEAFAAVDVPLILDGEVLAWDVANSRAMPFSALQTRIGRKKVTDAMRTADACRLHGV